MTPVASRLIPALLILGGMIISYPAAELLRPVKKLSDLSLGIALETDIPTSFGEWHTIDIGSVIIANPEQTEVLGRIYSQTLSRTYVSAKGYRIMLSIAYGTNQSDTMQVHRPEICYPAQGFKVHKNIVDHITTPYGEIPVRRLVTVQRQRWEPLTYWITTGDQVVTGRLSKKLTELSYGLRGQIPDGMLVRVSSIDDQDKQAFTNQDEFMRELLMALSPETRYRLSGLRQAEQ